MNNRELATAIAIKTLVGHWGAFIIFNQKSRLIIPIHAPTLAMAQLN
jgi:hypothetical protein